jgi:pre-mRNA-processing factor 40
VEEKERENLFQDYLDELWEKEKRQNRDEREAMIEKMKEHLQEMTLIKVSTTWEEASDLLKYNPVWMKMNDLDKLEAFSDYILNLERT